MDVYGLIASPEKKTNLMFFLSCPEMAQQLHLFFHWVAGRRGPKYKHKIMGVPYIKVIRKCTSHTRTRGLEVIWGYFNMVQSKT